MSFLCSVERAVREAEDSDEEGEIDEDEEEEGEAELDSDEDDVDEEESDYVEELAGRVRIAVCIGVSKCS